MAKSTELIPQTITDRVHALTEQSIKLRGLKSEAGRARKAVQDQAKIVEGIIDELVRADADARHLAFDFDADEEEGGE